MQQHTAYVALGANLGDRAANIQTAIGQLDATPGVRVTKRSSLLENPAVGGPDDAPPFLNAVVEVETTLAPHDLLARLLEIEKGLGRDRREKWEPRVIDLDLILYGDRFINMLSLQVPHPLMHKRRFVLEPLAEIAPRAAHPISELTAAEMLADLDTPSAIIDGVFVVDFPCAGCGYNLRGLPAQYDCPECGRPTPAAALRAAEEALVASGEATPGPATLDAVAARCGYDVAAVQLVLDAAVTGIDDVRSSNPYVTHLNAGQLVDFFLDRVREEFSGRESRCGAALNGWGVRGSEDVGRIVFALAEGGWLGKAEHDGEGDFDDLFRTDIEFPPAAG